MDTIIFFCRKRDIEEPLTEAIGQKTYLLIRVSLNVGREQWFGWKLEREEAKGSRGMESVAKGSGADSICFPAQPGRAPADEPGVEPESGRKRRIPFWRRLGMRLGKRKIEKQIRLEQEHRRASQRAMTEQVRQEMRSLSADILALSGDMSSCRCVYEDSVRDCLVGRKDSADKDSSVPSGSRQGSGIVSGAGSRQGSGIVSGAGSRQGSGIVSGAGSRQKAGTVKGDSVLQELWKECWQGEEFADYAQWEWVRCLLPQAVPFHFVILGNPSCAPLLLEHCARRMKSLRWFLPEEEYTEELEELLEDFYEENGLAAALQLLPGKCPFSRLRPECPEPCSILDFTEEYRISSSGLPEGSVWIDMASREEKGRRLTLRGDIRYVSLKEYWKKLPKRTKPGFCIPRDTASTLPEGQLPLYMRLTDNGKPDESGC